MQKTNFPFEVLIGEDDSSDGTREICIDYDKKHPDKIRLFLNNRKDVVYVNGYPTGRWNFINNIRHAEGKYIALLPGDDYWTDPLKLQKQVDILDRHPEFVACHHWHKYAYKDNFGKYVESPAPKKNGEGYMPKKVGNLQDIFANRLRLKSRTTMYRNLFKEINFPPDWYMKVAFGDVPLSMIMGKYGNFYFIDEPMAVYRITGKGVSTFGPKDRTAFLIEHNFNWTYIWDQGNRHYNYKYTKETAKTIIYFYRKIFKYKKYQLYFCSRILLERFFKRDLPIKNRIYEALELGKALLIGIFKYISKNMKKKPK